MTARGLAAVLCVVIPAAWAQPPKQAIDAVFADLRLEGTPGAAVLVIDHGRTVFRRGYGLADLSRRSRITPQTNFRLASLTKQFTAAAIMLLVRDGKLRYDDRLTDVLPQFPPYGRAITIRNLLNHTSGLIDYEDLWDQKYAGTPAEAVPQIRDAGVLELLRKESGTKFTPGTRFAYSNSGYAMLAMVVEQVSGQKFEDFLRERIFRPLGMRHTVAYVNGKNKVDNRAYGHTPKSGAWIRTDQSPTSAVLGDGGIYTSLDDLSKWVQALRLHKLLTAEEMQPALVPANVPEAAPSEEGGTYGFGWFLDPYKGHRRMWHYGSTLGFRTAIQYFPEDDLAIVVLCNRSDVDAAQRALKVADLFFQH